MPQLVSCSGLAISSVPKVIGVVPTGSSILVELLTDQELTSSNILVKGSSVDGPPQAYVVAVGSSLCKECEVKVGDRVVLSGNGTFVPKYDESLRTRLIVEVHNVKAIVQEEGRCCTK